MAQVPAAATDANAAIQMSREEAPGRLGRNRHADTNGAGSRFEECLRGLMEGWSGGVDLGLLPAFKFSMLHSE